MKKLPLNLADYPPVIWLRQSTDLQMIYLVVAIAPSAMTILDRYAPTAIPTPDLIHWEFSGDRLEWKPCYRESQS